jgi:hypothetical protein
MIGRVSFSNLQISVANQQKRHFFVRKKLAAAKSQIVVFDAMGMSHR